MAIATSTDPGGASEWRVDDELVRLRAWGTDIVHELPATAVRELLIGTDPGCWLELADSDHRVSRQHAKLRHEGTQWVIFDNKSKNGIRQDGGRRRSFPLTPGVEVGIGGFELVAESPRLIALRALLSRMLGWRSDRGPAVDLALRVVRLAATRRGSLLLCGEGDLVSIARLFHRHALGDQRPFVVCDPWRRQTGPSVRPGANYREGVPALAAATGGTLCIWQNRQPDDFAQVLAGLRERSARVQLVVCTHELRHREPLIASPIVLPSLAERGHELDRIIDENAAEAVAELGGSARFTPGDLAWIRHHEAASLAQIERATRRLVAIRGADGSITRAAAQLGMSHAALSEWVARRTLPA